MAYALVCPSCGEDEDLHGAERAGDIEVTCHACGVVWMRGAAVCASCGGSEFVERPQAMTRHSRGTQLSIIGWRQIPLCRVCDAQALQTSIKENRPVPGDYVSAAVPAPGMHTGNAAAPPAPSPRTHRDDSSARPSREAPRKQTERKQGATTDGLSTSGSPRSGSGAGRRSPKSMPSALPTVRQAIAAFLVKASGEVDQTAMLLLGTHLGSYNRLAALDQDEAATRLAAWFAQRWENPDSEAARRARDTLCRAVDFWGVRGWLTTNPAEELR